MTEFSNIGPVFAVEGEITVYGAWNDGIPAIAAGDYLFPERAVAESEPSELGFIKTRAKDGLPIGHQIRVAACIDEAFSIGKSTMHPEPALERGCTVLSHERALSDAMRLAAENRDLLAENATLRRRVEKLEKKR